MQEKADFAAHRSGLAAALTHTDAAEYPEPFITALADLIARCVRDDLPSSSCASRVRSLCFNIRANDELRRSLLTEALSPSELCKLDAAALATDALRRERKEAASRARAPRLSATMRGGSLTRSIVCPSCGGHEARFLHVGAQREMGKCEVWGSKDADGVYACLIECVACSHEWHGDEPAVFLPASVPSNEAPAEDVAAKRQCVEPPPARDEAATRRSAVARLSESLVEAAAGDRGHGAFLGSVEATGEATEAEVWRRHAAQPSMYDECIDVLAQEIAAGGETVLDGLATMGIGEWLSSLF